MTESTLQQLRQGRRRRSSRYQSVLTVLGVIVIAGFIFSLMYGHTVYSFGEVWATVLGQQVPGAEFTVGKLRLPRALVAVAVGFAFGMAGATFQTLLRNPLASPDIIGITAGAGAAAAFGIVVLRLSNAQVSVFAIVGGLAVALGVYLLSYRTGVVGTRLILVGIGVAAMLDSATAYILSRAGEWDLQQAMRWLSGSLNGTSWADVRVIMVALVALVPIVIANTRNLTVMRMGDDASAALGVRVERTRVTLILAAVGLIAFGTSVAGPIAFVAFLSGPIAARLIRGSGAILIPAGFVGAALVVVADFFGQWLLGTRFPVGVVTGVLGAPYLIYLIIRANRNGGAI